MSNAQEIVRKVQDQTLDAVRATQHVVVETITAWTETTHKVTEQLPDFVKGYEVPGLADFVNQFPTAEDAIDAGFDFAQQLLTNQRIFSKRVIAASTPKTTVTAPMATVVKAIDQSPRPTASNGQRHN